eukprot:CAMPEP_0172158346 /NCGR_PEP_ID=MMETSP1050-20130122/4321_1 /TAXON_ID=233186 /ORGANISM="Cryptomonas curvata, Strain CCAP979/52" /LENGTH=187 /DNA_ID=CAMNT_0012827727 /DNA_START=643 /DNA_END=1205 /DNA_ORIENTATION=-
MTATATAVTDAALSATGAALNVMDAALIEAVGARRVGLGLLVVAMMLAVGHVAAVAHRVLVRLHGIGSGAGARSMIGSASAAEVERQQVGGYLMGAGRDLMGAMPSLPQRDSGGAVLEFGGYRLCSSESSGGAVLSGGVLSGGATLEAQSSPLLEGPAAMHLRAAGTLRAMPCGLVFGADWCDWCVG